jgi:hypothetical protein
MVNLADVLADGRGEPSKVGIGQDQATLDAGRCSSTPALPTGTMGT